MEGLRKTTKKITFSWPVSVVGAWTMFSRWYFLDCFRSFQASCCIVLQYWAVNCTFCNVSNHFYQPSCRSMHPSQIHVLSFWRNRPPWARVSSFTRFPDQIQRRTAVGRASLDEWSARIRDLYLTTHKTHNIQTSMSPVGFEPTISASRRPQIHALDRAATGIGSDTSS